MKGHAVFSQDKQYRYALWRHWDDDKPSICFIGLNPSTADGNTDDPTIKRCIGIAKHQGFGSLSMANLFAYRSTSPKSLATAISPVGRNNDDWIKALTHDADCVVACWGNKGSFNKRDAQVLQYLNNLYYLELTNNGMPRHPLYMTTQVQLHPLMGATQISNIDAPPPQ